MKVLEFILTFMMGLGLTVIGLVFIVGVAVVLGFTVYVLWVILQACTLLAFGTL